MEDIMTDDDLAAPEIVDRSAFQAELDALRVREKAHTREGDAIAAARRRLPMVEVDGATPLIGEHGTVTLLDAFERRRLLIAYYFMWHAGQPAAQQCEGCTLYTSQIRELSFIHARDVTYATFCQGPYDRPPWACPGWAGGAPNRRCSFRKREGGRGDQTWGTRHDPGIASSRRLCVRHRSPTGHRSKDRSCAHRQRFGAAELQGPAGAASSDRPIRALPTRADRLVPGLNWAPIASRTQGARVSGRLYSDHGRVARAATEPTAPL